jgi:glutamyl-tRNA reductase
VPRDIEPAVNDLDGVYLYDIDSLQAIADQAMNVRRQDLATCEEIIEQHVTTFVEWLDAEAQRNPLSYARVLSANEPIPSKS